MNKSAKRLAECISLAKGKPPAQMPYYGEGAEPYLNPEYLRGNASAEFAKPAVNSVRVQDDDAVLLWDGSNAGEFFKGRKGLLASTMSRISHGDEFGREYFYYAVKRWEPFIKGQTSGSGIPHVDKEILGNLEILCLEPEEQTQIATILSTLDRAIAQTETIIVKQQRIKAGLMQDLLTKGIDENGVIRSEATHQFKDSPLGRIPVEWDTAKIGDVLTEKPKNGYSPKEVDGWTGTQMLGLGCLSTDGFRPVQLKNAPLDDLRLSNALLKDGDFLISRSNTRDLVGLVGIFREIGVPCIYPDLIVRLRFDSSVSTKFMEFIFRHHLLRSQLTNSAVGTSGSMVKINAEVITTSCFLKPNIEEQERIVCLLKQMAAEICELQKYTSKLNSIKIGVMHDLLTGTVRVN